MAADDTQERKGRLPLLPQFGLGLRGRITLAFGLVALLVSGLLAIVAWSLVSSYLLAQREQTTLRQAVSGARILQHSLGSTSTTIPELLDSLPASIGAESLLFHDGRWYTSSLQTDPRVIPPDLRRVVFAGQAARQRIHAGGTLVLVVGLPLPDNANNAYFAVFPLTELDRTYRVLSITLAVAAVASTAVGAVTGRLASQRALRPLRQVTEAAAAVAAGHLETRLPAHARDPELSGLAASFNQTADALQRRVEADARFAGDVSHELRTPLTTMLNAVALLRARHAALPPPAQAAVEMLEEEMGRFRQLTTDLLEISRVEEDTALSTDVEPVLIAELVRRAADNAADRPITVVSPGAETALVGADKRRLERVVVNLVQNAESHGEGCLEVRVECRTGVVAVVVDDAGPGVPTELRERVFERFARGAAGREGGTGLGLAIAARHVAAHSGRIFVTDRPGGGARFVLELPVRTP